MCTIGKAYDMVFCNKETIKMTYEDLLDDGSDMVGKIFKYIRLTDTVTAKVIGYDFDIGITAIDVDTKEYLLCVNGKLSPVNKMKNIRPYDEERYTKLFNYITDAIQNGTFNAVRASRVLNKGRDYGVPNSEMCAFGQ